MIIIYLFTNKYHEIPLNLLNEKGMEIWYYIKTKTKCRHFCVPYIKVHIEWWGSCYSICSFMCMICRSLFVIFPLAIVLSVLPRFTDSDYHFDILKLFLRIHATRVWYCFFSKVVTNFKYVKL
jgi:hypothetical protein